MAWELLNPRPLAYSDSAHLLQIYRDAIDLTFRLKVRFRQKKCQNEVQIMLFKLVLVTDPLDHSGVINSLSNLVFGT